MSVSVVISSYDRFRYLLNAIDSVRTQTYKASQIIVVNDGSTQPEYYSYDFGSDVVVVHLSKNTRDILGMKIPGGVQRNIGVMLSFGKYVAFLDDDDFWLPNKLELQISEMEKTGMQMSATEGFFGYGVYDKTKVYPKYHSEHYFDTLKGIFGNTNFLENGIPPIFTLDFLRVHNCCIASSVVVNRELFIQKGLFNKMSYADDYDSWLRILQHTNCCHIQTPCVYYDAGHADGKLY